MTASGILWAWEQSTPHDLDSAQINVLALLANAALDEADKPYRAFVFVDYDRLSERSNLPALRVAEQIFRLEEIGLVECRAVDGEFPTQVVLGGKQDA